MPGLAGDQEESPLGARQQIFCLPVIWKCHLSALQERIVAGTGDAFPDRKIPVLLALAGCSFCRAV